MLRKGVVSDLGASSQRKSLKRIGPPHVGGFISCTVASNVAFAPEAVDQITSRYSFSAC
jgi:hypothetical protein